MLLRSSALLLAAFASHAALAQNNIFELHLNGKKIGKDTYTIAKAKQGYKLASHYSYSALGNEGQFNAEYHYDDNYGFIDGSLDNTGTMLQHSYTPNKAHTELTIATTQQGSQMTDIVDIKPDFLLLPNFDPGAAQALLLHAATHPTPDNKYNLLIPSVQSAGGGGRGGRGSAPPAAASGAPTGDTLPAGDHSYEAVWVKGGPLTGTLAGKPINVNTYALAFGSFRWIFFADEQNNLMQLNVTLLHASYIRTDFRLDPPRQAMPQ
jgi:hypothetical protein